MNWIKLFVCWVMLCGAIASAWGIGGLPSHNASLAGGACNAIVFGNSTVNNTWTNTVTTTITISLNANATVVLNISTTHPTVNTLIASVTSANLTYTKRFSQVTAWHLDQEIWWAHSSSILSNEAITITGASAPDTATAVAAEYRCATNPPWDTNVSLPGSNSNTGGATTCPLTANMNSNTAAPTVIWVNSSAAANGGIPSGFTGYSSSASNIGGATTNEQRTAYQQSLGKITNQNFTTGVGSANWAVYCDVLVPQ